MIRGAWSARASAEGSCPKQSRAAIGPFFDRRWTMATSSRAAALHYAWQHQVEDAAPRRSDPCEPGITVVALFDGIVECKGAGVYDAKADRVLCWSSDRPSH